MKKKKKARLMTRRIVSVSCSEDGEQFDVLVFHPDKL